MGFTTSSANRLTALAAGAIAIVAMLAMPAIGAAQDRNHDRIPDRWEKRHHLSLKVKQARRDQDSDGLRNRGEYRAGLNPRDEDTDNDGTEDGDENAGTVASFEDGVLTISLYAGGSVTGQVTDDTRIVCPPPAGEPGEEEEESFARPAGPGGEEGGPRPPRGGCGDERCSPDELTEGTEVREADLRVSGSGQRFTVIKLG